MRRKSLFLEESAIAMMAKANPKADADIPIPPCPYNDDDNIEEGVTCYITGCKTKMAEMMQVASRDCEFIISSQ